MCLFHSVHQGYDGAPGPKGQKGYPGKSGHDVMLFCTAVHSTYMYIYYDVPFHIPI